MTYFLFYVILNDSEESHRKTYKTYTILTLVVGYFATLNMTFVWLPPSGEARIYFKSAVKLARSSSNALSACALSLPFTE